ncbi:hypothetical protein [Methylobacterium sp. WL8]|uniref:hypothetical protein n=1 Tax=Methylobacterium sp. WL8 TaxID=2603899 RepID=UPI0011C79715|nr:hypothetical protein [Methylobacterium sp. WL8]TXN76564.1 hypothetical protein FV234_24550 [Methylobacterium sp. WL8]
MSARVIPFQTRSPAEPMRVRGGGTVYLVEGENGGWLVADFSRSGDSAGLHGWHADRADAMAEGRELARSIGATFLDDDGDAA